MVAPLSIRAIRGQVFSLSEPQQQDEFQKTCCDASSSISSHGPFYWIRCDFCRISGISPDHTEPLGRLLRFY
jgi:hypothetical protein